MSERISREARYWWHGFLCALIPTVGLSWLTLHVYDELRSFFG